MRVYTAHTYITRTGTDARFYPYKRRIIFFHPNKLPLQAMMTNWPTQRGVNCNDDGSGGRDDPACVFSPLSLPFSAFDIIPFFGVRTYIGVYICI